MITTLLLAAALQDAAMPAAQATDVPHCSATVTDGCMEGPGMAKHKMMKHHAMHKKTMHKTMKKTETK